MARIEARNRRFAGSRVGPNFYPAGPCCGADWDRMGSGRAVGDLVRIGRRRAVAALWRAAKAEIRTYWRFMESRHPIFSAHWAHEPVRSPAFRRCWGSVAPRIPPKGGTTNGFRDKRWLVGWRRFMGSFLPGETGCIGPMNRSGSRRFAASLSPALAPALAADISGDAADSTRLATRLTTKSSGAGRSRFMGSRHPVAGAQIRLPSPSNCRQVGRKRSPTDQVR